MGAFNVNFGIDLGYSDPDYRMIYVKVSGDAEVSCDGRDGSERDTMFVTNLITSGLMDAFPSLSQEKVSYKDIASHSDAILSAVKEQCAASGVTVASFRLAGVVPNETSREIIRKTEEMQRISKMTPEELAKLQQEKMEEAKRRWEALSPEEKARAEAERTEEAVESMKRAQELAMKMAASGDATAARAASVNADMAAMKAAALGGTAAIAAAPRFCSNCGAPNKGGKFCGNCGNAF